MRVLLIEPDMVTAQSVELFLKTEGFNVYTTDLGEEGVDLGKLYDYDIIITETDLPDMTGSEVIKLLRNAKCFTPIIVVSGNSNIEAKIVLLGIGADDYMTKPFHKDELVIRIHSAVRRVTAYANKETFTCGPITIDPRLKLISVDEMNVHLSRHEYKILELLFKKKDSAVSTNHILDYLYGGIDEPNRDVVKTFVSRIRTKFRDVKTGSELHIKTVRGWGLKLVENP